MKRTFLPMLVCWCSMVASVSAIAQTQILKCVAPDGAVSFVDARQCPAATQESQVAVEEHKVTLTEMEKARARAVNRPAPEVRTLLIPEQSPPRQARNSARTARDQSYHCTAGALSWYMHNPCPPTVTLGPDPYQTDSIGRFTSPQSPVQQEPVSRAVACKEIESPGAGGRSGSALDTRVGSYDKLKGLDPCH